MTNEELKRYEDRLMALREELSHQIKGAIKDTDMGSETADASDEEADEAEEQGVAYAVQISLKERLSAVLDALHKIKNGLYGVCEKCGEKIEIKILDADLESRYCKACKAPKA